ncbi:MAG TPA: histidine kinase [Candidatus Angelobacter sp.]|nr:histidine kinase [Candidatus Angelobacter sp.]
MAFSAFAQSPALPLLTHLEQIKRLTPAEAKLGYPVRIRGVITGDVPAPDFFVQDGPTGIYVEGNHSYSYTHRLGDRVEVEGVSGPGRFAPVVLEQKLRILGPGKLPKARPYTLNELANGRHDGEWVRVRGTVLSASIDRLSWPEPALVMIVASSGGRFKLRVPIVPGLEASSWIDRQIVAEGVSGVLFNFDRQLVGILLYVPRLKFVREAEQAREVALDELLRFSPDQNTFQRVRVRGVLVYQQPGNSLFLETNGKGLRILSQQKGLLEPGDVVEASGFPAVGESTPILEDALFRKIAHTSPSPAVMLELQGPMERFDGRLVTINAEVLQREGPPDSSSFLLRSGDKIFTVSAQTDATLEHLHSISAGSAVRVTGICLVQSGGIWGTPQSLRLLVREPSDISVLRAPSWWNLRHAFWLLVLCTIVLFAVTALLVIVGKRLRIQMALVGEKKRMVVIHEERDRIARELHDTLEQELAGITLHLDLAVDCFHQAPQTAREAVETARNMSRRSMTEARRSVWDLRCRMLEDGDLVSALAQTVESISNGELARIQVKVEGEPRRLPATTELNLLRIGQEAAVNAVKHARPSRVTLLLQFHPRFVRLCIQDDGCGFEPTHAVLNGSGHFGLLDMRERAQSLGSHLEIHSKPGGGTRIELEVPQTQAVSEWQPIRS